MINEGRRWERINIEHSALFYSFKFDWAVRVKGEEGGREGEEAELTGTKCNPVRWKLIND